MILYSGLAARLVIKYDLVPIGTVLTYKQATSPKIHAIIGDHFLRRIRRQDTHTKRIVIALFVVATFLRASAQIETHGSIAYADWSQNEIVIAADSRQMSGESYSDTGCKVATLGTKLIFAATGRGRVGTFDIYALAPKLLPSIPHKGASKELARKMADAWGKQVKDEFQRVGDIAVEGLDPGYVSTGLFADFETDGSLLVAVAKITFDRKQGGIEVFSHTKIVPTSPATSYTLGHNEILNELAARATPRGIAWWNTLKSKVGASKDPVAGEAIGVVDLTITNLEKTKLDGNLVRFSEVGPPVAAVRLIRGKSTEWVTKGKCE